LRFQPALIFPLAASRQLRRALTIRYRYSFVDSNIPGTSLDQGVSSHFKILSTEIEIEPTYPQSPLPILDPSRIFKYFQSSFEIEQTYTQKPPKRREIP